MMKLEFEANGSDREIRAKSMPVLRKEERCTWSCECERGGLR